MKTNYKDNEALFQEKENYRQLCEAMYQEGIIKQNEEGVIVPVDDPLERESIKSKSKHKPSMSDARPRAEMDNDPFKTSQKLDDDNDQMNDLA